MNNSKNNQYEELINTYLWFGYIPPKEFPDWLYDCMTPENRGKEYSTKEAAQIWDNLFDKLIDENKSHKHIVPLSGGYDSRAILAALLERLDASQIETISFGAPGQLDYDIGKMVAERAGVKHYEVDLSRIKISWDEIKCSVLKSPWTYVPDGYFNQITQDQVTGYQDSIWIGFLGDPLTGSHISINNTLNSSRNEFINKQRRVKSLWLCKSNYDPSISLPGLQNKCFKKINDLLDFGIRQYRCVAPIVLPGAKWNKWGGYLDGDFKNNIKIIVPFADNYFAGYWLSAPDEVRKNQMLYLKLLLSKYEKLFILPSKQSFGKRLDSKNTKYILRMKYKIISNIKKRVPWLGIKSNLMINYVDYEEMFRSRRDYQESLIGAFDYLRDRDAIPWLDFDKLWRHHMKSYKNYGDAFVVLIGLAANMAVNDMK